MCRRLPVELRRLKSRTSQSTGPALWWLLIAIPTVRHLGPRRRITQPMLSQPVNPVARGQEHSFENKPSQYAACELHARVAGAVHAIPTVGLRFFNLYSPRQDRQSPYSGVIALFAERLARGEPVEIFGDGKQIRDFTYIGDAVAALDRALSVVSTDAPVFNVCTGRGRRCVGLPKS